MTHYARPLAMIVADLPPWMIRLYAGVFGLLIGSFLNVVIARLPRGESVVRPGSHCVCGKPIKPWDNIPIVSWLLLRARARCCGAPISIRYPIVEAIGGAVVLAIFEVEVVQQMGAAHALPLLARALVDSLLALALVAAAFIDLDHMYLPDPITMGGTVLAIASAGLRPEQGYVASLIGAAAGFVGIWLPFIVGWRWLRGQAGMGLGDAKLVALFGAWLGGAGIFFSLFAASFQGIAATLVVMARHGEVKEPESVVKERADAIAAGEPLDDDDPLAHAPESGLGKARIPFGPFLILGALEFLLLRSSLLLPLMNAFALMGEGARAMIFERR
ncbi:MAG: prepilin peptidase [Polyangiales bacterium]